MKNIINYFKMVGLTVTMLAMCLVIIIGGFNIAVALAVEMQPMEEIPIRNEEQIPTELEIQSKNSPAKNMGNWIVKTPINSYVVKNYTFIRNNNCIKADEIIICGTFEIKSI